MKDFIQQDLITPLTAKEIAKIKKWKRIQHEIAVFKGAERKESRNEAKKFLSNLSTKFLTSEVFVREVFKYASDKRTLKRLLGLIPRQLMRNEDFILYVAQIVPEIIKDLPLSLKSKKHIYQSCVKNNGEVIQYLNASSVDRETAELAIKNTYKAYFHLGEVFQKDPDICLQVLEKSPKTYKKICYQFKNEFNFCKRAVSRNPKVWFYFEDIIKNDRFIIEHVFRTFKLDLEGIGLKNNNLQESTEFCKMPFFLFSSLNYSQNEKDFLKKLMMAYCTNNTKQEVFEILQITKKTTPDQLSGPYEEYFN